MTQCTICRHQRRAEIDAAVMQDGASKKIATSFGVSLFALKRHRAHTAELIAATPTKKVMEACDADSLMEKIARLEHRAEGLLDKAENAGDIRAALAAVGTLKNLLEFLANISGALKPAQHGESKHVHFHLPGGEKGLDDGLQQLIERARLFEPRREIKALPPVD